MTTNSANLATIQAFSDKLWAHKDITAIDQFFAADVTIHSPLESTRGTDGFQAVIGQWLQAFPDLTVTWEDFICDDTKVVSRWRATGSQQGEFRDIPATGRTVDYTGVTIYELKDGKVVHYWATVDMATILQQLTD